MARNIYNSLKSLVRRIIEFMTNRYLILAPIGIGFGIAILIWLTTLSTTKLLFDTLLFFGIILTVFGFCDISLGIKKGIEQDKQIEAERVRIQALMDNLPNAINTAVREGIEQSGLQVSINELNHSIKDLPNKIGEAVSESVSKTFDMNKFKEAVWEALKEDRAEQRKEKIDRDGNW